MYYGDDLTFSDGSLSARRAWIEISTVIVILRKRNTSLSARRAWIEINRAETAKTSNASLSARRAWIEITAGCWRESRRASLSARRAWIEIVDYIIDYVNDASRSPQGERG